MTIYNTPSADKYMREREEKKREWDEIVRRSKMYPRTHSAAGTFGMSQDGNVEFSTTPESRAAMQATTQEIAAQNAREARAREEQTRERRNALEKMYKETKDERMKDRICAEYARLDGLTVAQAWYFLSGTRA
jgi:hypothetical protein